jgi:hypothetical protein
MLRFPSQKCIDSTHWSKGNRRGVIRHLVITITKLEYLCDSQACAETELERDVVYVANPLLQRIDLKGCRRHVRSIVHSPAVVMAQVIHNAGMSAGRTGAAARRSAPAREAAEKG